MRRHPDLTWDGEDATGRPVSPGIYFVRFIADSETQATKRLVLIR